MDYTKFPNEEILCIDMKSFYASCSAVMLGLDPLKCHLAVVGDVEREGSVVLAASPKMKSEYGIRTGARKFEIPIDPKIQVVHPKMRTYLEISMEIARLFQRYVPQHAIHVYSVDECFLKVGGLSGLWGDKWEIAEKIQKELLTTFQLPCSVGIGPNMLMSKLCLDLDGKKQGIAEWTYDDIPNKLWPISPLREMWGIGRKTERTLNGMGIFTVGQLANYSLESLEKKLGIMGNQLYHHAWGIDFSEIGAPIVQGQVSYGKSQILMRDYTDLDEISAVVLEMCEEVARRARTRRKAGRTVHFGLSYSRDENGGGFYRSLTLEEPTNITLEIYQACLKMMATFYRGETVRQVRLTLENIVPDDCMQENLFMEDRGKIRELGYVMDGIRNKHGNTALLRGVSYTKGGTAFERSKLVGGHKA